jgi:metallo-beta-lactamase family protein
VRIFGVERDLRAQVVVLNGFSAHADQNDLVEFAEAVRKDGTLASVALVHGDPKPQDILKGLLDARNFPKVKMPAPGERLQL